MKHIVIALLISLIWLAGCATPTNTWDTARRIQVGMTTAEMVSLLGQPDKVEQLEGVESWSWNLQGGGPDGGITVIVQDGKALRVPTIPDFNEK